MSRLYETIYHEDGIKESVYSRPCPECGSQAWDADRSTGGFECACCGHKAQPFKQEATS